MKWFFSLRGDVIGLVARMENAGMLGDARAQVRAGEDFFGVPFNMMREAETGILEVGADRKGKLAVEKGFEEDQPRDEPGIAGDAFPSDLLYADACLLLSIAHIAGVTPQRVWQAVRQFWAIGNRRDVIPAGQIGAALTAFDLTFGDQRHDLMFESPNSRQDDLSTRTTVSQALERIEAEPDGKRFLIETDDHFMAWADGRLVDAGDPDPGARVRTVTEIVALAGNKVAKAFNEDQPRDEHGRWAGAGGYVYHGTSKQNVEQIAREGLAPDPHNYFTSTEEGAHGYAVGEHDVLRVKAEHIPRLEYAGHSRYGGVNSKTPDRIRPEHIEIKNDDGSWSPISGNKVAKRKAQGRSLGAINTDRKAATDAQAAMHALWRSIFHRQTRAVRRALLAAKKLAKQEGEDDDEPSDEDINNVVDGIDLGLTDAQWRELETETANLAEDAGGEALGQVGLGDRAGMFEHMSVRARDWAKEHSAELVTRVNDTTRDQVRQAIVDGYENNLSVAEIADSIEEIGGFSEDRAALIASTEVRFANSYGALEGYREARDGGVALMKEWLAGPDACEEFCQPNADQGPIDLDEDFDSGDDAPPAHPNCRCAVSPVVGGADEGAEEEE